MGASQCHSNKTILCNISVVLTINRPLSHGGHFESQENKKLCFCTSSLALDQRLDVQNLLFQHCVIKVYCLASTGSGIILIEKHSQPTPREMCGVEQQEDFELGAGNPQQFPICIRWVPQSYT